MTKSFIKTCSSVIGYLSRLNAPLSANCDPIHPRADLFRLGDHSQSCSFEYSFNHVTLTMTCSQKVANTFNPISCLATKIKTASFRKPAAPEIGLLSPVVGVQALPL